MGPWLKEQPSSCKGYLGARVPMLLSPEGGGAPSQVLVGIVLSGSAHLQAAWEVVRGQNGVQASRSELAQEFGCHNLPVNTWVSSEGLALAIFLIVISDGALLVCYACNGVPGLEKTLGLRGDLDLRHVFLVAGVAAWPTPRRIVVCTCCLHM